MTSFVVAALFALPIGGAILAALLVNFVNNFVAILLVSVAWYAAVLMILRIRARRRKIVRVDP